MTIRSVIDSVEQNFNELTWIQPVKTARKGLEITWLSQFMEDRPSLGPGEIHRMCKVVKVFDEKLRATLSKGRLSPYTRALSVNIYNSRMRVLTQFKSLCNKMMESNADVISHLEGLVKSDKETRGQIELLLEGANEMVCFLNHLQSPQKVPLDYNQRSARSYLGRSLKLTSCFTFR